MIKQIKQKIVGMLTEGERPKPPYRLGVALSGGGARGFAHVGALKALEEAGMKPDVIAGVSAGAVAAVMYAAGVPLDEMLSLFTSTKFTDFARPSLIHGDGMFSLMRFKQFIEEATGIDRLENLRIPTYVGVTDLDHGEPAEFHEGPLGERVVASCSIPIVFSPVEIDGIHYVDGGVLRNLPAWIIREKCETLIGINVSPLRTFEYKKSFLDIGMRTYNLMAKANQQQDMDICDHVIITPELIHYQVFNLKDIHKAYLSGYAAAHRAIRQWLRAEEKNPR
ncbi:MAG: patatin-like phospholipase family protein [bacterium]|jgi:NTE family protein|nr:patatin-like phospholipase family protein [bacterium]